MKFTSILRIIAMCGISIGLVNCGNIHGPSKRSETLGSDASSLGLKGQAGSTSSLPATKAAFSFSDVAIMDQGDVEYTTVLKNSLKTSNRALFIDMSLECGLLTKTLVKSKNGTKDTSTATAAVMVRVLVDGKVVAPGEITYCKRTQELSATFGGILQSCTDANADGVLLASECTFTDEELSLLLSTMNAASFNFISDILSSGVHNIEVQAKIHSSTEVQAGSAEAKGFIGKGSVVMTSERTGK